MRFLRIDWSGPWTKPWAAFTFKQYVGTVRISGPVLRCTWTKTADPPE